MVRVSNSVAGDLHVVSVTVKQTLLHEQVHVVGNVTVPVVAIVNKIVSDEKLTAKPPQP